MSFPTIPDAPTTVETEVLSSTQIALRWSPVSGADGYYVFKYNTSLDVWERISPFLTALSFIDNTDLRPWHHYGVCACNKCGCSPKSEALASVPCAEAPPPLGLEVQTIGETYVTLRWTTNASPPLSQYTVMYGESLLSMVEAPGSPTAYGIGTFAIEDLDPNTHYYFEVIAHNGCDYSGESDTVEATTLCPTPDVPNLHLMVVSTTQVNISWAATANAVNYIVERKKTGDVSWTVLNGAYGSTMYIDTSSIEEDSEYCYRVKTHGVCADSAYSNVACRTTPDEPPECGTSASTFNWITVRSGEPGYATNPSGIAGDGTPNAANYISFSPSGAIDVSAACVDKIVFANDCLLDDILIMIHPSDNVVQTFITGPDGTGRGTTHYQIPSRAMFVANTFGHYINSDKYNRAGEKVVRCSMEKRFTQTTTGLNHTVLAGTPCGAGIQDSGHASDFAAKGFTVIDFASGVTKSLLQSKGFIDTDDVFRFKFVLILCGHGQAVIKGMTCHCVPMMMAGPMMAAPPMISSPSQNECCNITVHDSGSDTRKGVGCDLDNKWKVNNSFAKLTKTTAQWIQPIGTRWVSWDCKAKSDGQLYHDFVTNVHIDPCVNLAKLVLKGEFAVDNSLDCITVNDTLIPVNGGGPTIMTPFTLYGTNGFTHGNNKVSFRIYDYGGFGGIVVKWGEIDCK